MQKQTPISPNGSLSDTPRIASSRALALIPGTLAFILYFVTLSPTINFTDSGELITVAWTGGVAHPPGYPLYSLVSSALIHIPVGDPAWRMNLLSALFAALAVSLFYILVSDTLRGMPAFRQALAPRQSSSRLSAASSGKSAPSGKSARATSTPSHPVPATSEDAGIIAWTAIAGGMAASGLLAVSLTFWNWATQAKFYTLHFAFVAAILWLSLRARHALISSAPVGFGAPGKSSKSGKLDKSSTPLTSRWSPKAWPPVTRLLHLLALTIGLSLTNHFLTFLLLPGVALLLLTPFRTARQMLRHLGRYAPTILIAGLLPLLIYLYLPLRAATHPLIAWGLPDTWNNFWRQVTAQSYQGFFSTADFGNHVVDAAIYAANQFGPWLGVVLLALIAAGVTYLWRMDRGLLAGTALVALTSVLVAINYSIREIATYYVPFYMVALWWAGLGVVQGVVWVNRRLSSADASAPTAKMLPRNMALTLALGALLPLAGLAANWGAAGHQNNYTAELFVRNAFKNYRQNAVVLTNYWDLTSASFYLQNVLGERRDVTIIDKSLLRQPFYIDYLERNYPDLIGKNAGPFAEYKALLLQFLNTGKVPARLNASYLNVLNGFVDSNLGQRPVYAELIAEASDIPEQQDARALFKDRQLVRNNIGYRIAAGADDLRAQDPQFDLRGITSQKVPLDEIEASVIALYPPSLQNIGAYMQNSSTPSDKEVGTRLIAQAQELQSFAALHNARPHLR